MEIINEILYYEHIVYSVDSTHIGDKSNINSCSSLNQSSAISTYEYNHLPSGCSANSYLKTYKSLPKLSKKHEF